jgi:hypothetical protein
VLILLASAAVSFVLALLEGGDNKTAFVDPAVVSYPDPQVAAHCLIILQTDYYYSNS